MELFKLFYLVFCLSRKEYAVCFWIMNLAFATVEFIPLIVYSFNETLNGPSISGRWAWSAIP